MVVRTCWSRTVGLMGVAAVLALSAGGFTAFASDHSDSPLSGHCVDAACEVAETIRGDAPEGVGRPRGAGLGRSSSAQSQSASVEIGDNYFSPKSVTVKVGVTVTWTNRGERPHTVTADDGSFDSGGDASDYVLPGQTFSHTFTKTGRFPYYCRLHGGHGGAGQAGVITVTAGGSGAGDEQSFPAPRRSEAEPTRGRQAQSAPSSGTRAVEHYGDLASTGVPLSLLAAGVLLVVTGSGLVRVSTRSERSQL